MAPAGGTQASLVEPPGMRQITLDADIPDPYDY